MLSKVSHIEGIVGSVFIIYKFWLNIIIRHERLWPASSKRNYFILEKGGQLDDEESEEGAASGEGMNMFAEDGDIPEESGFDFDRDLELERPETEEPELEGSELGELEIEGL